MDALPGPVSREILAQPDAAQLLNAAVRKAMTRKANRAYLAQVAPVAPATRPPAGIINQTITDGGALGSELDGLVDAIAAIEDAGGTATNILASPSAWAAGASSRPQPAQHSHWSVPVPMHPSANCSRCW
ncbi:phage major capsid protein [Mycolicibacterium sp. P1-5]|uniref:phage major capsid protein n=1 Tax=Mycolicibacterium sp. P1-5 TaxID=2024617 RepID=UPI0011EE7598|nr:phage major capsid protein [Mycolicibacterium sp. P1-5]KAA0112064.1 hypothetical protein CIW47_02180 [Mycolicibacterium sp. P1-5]